MISFVWSSKHPFYAGTGGSENYTAGQIRELMRRGIPARILTLGHGENDGRDQFPDIPFKALESKEELAQLDDTIIFVTYPLNVKTKRQSYAILHCPPPSHTRDTQYDTKGFKGKRLLATSKFSSKLWRPYSSTGLTRIPTVYPFAEGSFAAVKRPKRPADAVRRILFAGRLDPEKGIYTLLTALHMPALKAADFELTVTDACSHSEDGAILMPLLKAHSKVKLVPARRSAETMAELMADHDIVVMPSTSIFWQETFGMLSVEGQHAGCRVVASRSGGLSETDCGGGLLTVASDNPKALADGLAKAIELGPLTEAQRQVAATRFTVKQSVDALLAVLMTDMEKLKQKVSLHGDGVLVPRLYPQLSLIGDRLLQSPYLQERAVGKLRAGLKS